MKRFILFLIALAWAAQGLATPGEVQLAEAVAAAHRAVAVEQREATEAQSLEKLNAAAREEVIGKLGLNAAQRKRFEPLYDSYRAALDKAIQSELPEKQDDASQRFDIKRKLANIAAAAQVKHDYVDRFAELLTADQIRLLYNTEGAIGAAIKQAASQRQPLSYTGRLKGSGRKVTQDLGPAGDYASLAVASFLNVTVSPTARTVSITADDNVIDYISMESGGGKLAFKLNASGIENVSVAITVPMSASLNKISAKSYGKVTCLAPLKGSSANISVSSYGAVDAQIESSGSVVIDVASYGKFSGSVSGRDARIRILSYSSFRAPISCHDSCEITVESYAKYHDNINAPRLTVATESYSSITGTLTADMLTLSVGSYAKFDGAINARNAKLHLLSSGSLTAAFTGDLLEASVVGYGKMSLKGSAAVSQATVKVSTYGTFSAPELRVVNYNVSASGRSRAEVWCSGILKTDRDSRPRISYAGPCKIDVSSESMQRGK